jgi:glycerophosphoryl diester phosphodiesterase
MKTIVAGGRNMNQYELVQQAIADSGFEITELVSGGAAGVDKLGERYALESNTPLVVMQADWNQHGRAAGPIRNRQMAEYADALIAVWDGESKGTKNMIQTAEKLGLQVYVKTTKVLSTDGAYALETKE